MAILRTRETYWTNRLYFNEKKTSEDMKQVLYAKGVERKALGLTEYSTFKKFFYLIGLAFKTKDKDGNDLYINKKSFCHYCTRSLKGAKNVDTIYQERSIAKKELKTAYQVFKEIYPENKDESISTLAYKVTHEIRNLQEKN